MSTGITGADPVDSLVSRLAERDRAGAATLLDELERLGTEPGRIIEKLLAPTQQRVGELWHTDQWSVADEHAATAIVDRLLADAARRIDVVPIYPEIMVACAEGEWHSLPARMFAELLRMHGWLVTFLGGSVPADHLGRLVGQTRPHAVVISGTVPIFLSGALRSVAAIGRHGVPVLVGGAAFGPDSLRARALGADAWADSAAAADKILQGWQVDTPSSPTPRDAGPALALEADRSGAVDAAMIELGRRLPDMGTDDERQLTRTREDLHYILRFAENSLLTGDDRIFTDFVPWLTDLWVARGLAASTVALGLEVLHDVLPAERSSARKLLADGARFTRNG